MKKYLITGATGYIGSMIVKFLLARNNGEEIHITAPVRDMEKAGWMYGQEEGEEGRRNRLAFVRADLSDSADVSRLLGEYDYLIHCAAVTKSSEMTSQPVETIQSIVNVTQNVMELAGKCGVKSVVFLSSMEVYGRVYSSGDKRITEEELGDLEIFNVRNCYPMAKRMAENICFCYYKEYGVPVKIARLAQTFGRGILPGENRVFAQFAAAVREKRDIVLHTEGRSMGNYCEILDAVRAVLLLLEKGENGEAYNVVNEENTMTIREMAQLVAERVAEGRIGVVYEIPEGNRYGYAADTGLKLSAKKLRALGWQPTGSLEQMYRDALGQV